MFNFISIHALLAESDVAPVLAVGRAGYFYPRSPCGERQALAYEVIAWNDISIHALLAESDHPRVSGTAPHIYFYPRSPCGERLRFFGFAGCLILFLSTLSLRRATPPSMIRKPTTGHFYPRSPCGERPHNTRNNCIDYCISIHALLAESDVPTDGLFFLGRRFLSTLSLRRATWAGGKQTLS